MRANQAEGRAGDQQVGSEKPLSAEDTAWLEQSEVQRALKVIREAARVKPQSIRPADNLELDLGLDSMQRVELLVALEQQLGGDLDESRLSEIYTVRELVDAARESAARGKTGPPHTQFPGWKAVLQEEYCGPRDSRSAPATAVQGNILVCGEPIGPDRRVRPFSSPR